MKILKARLFCGELINILMFPRKVTREAIMVAIKLKQQTSL